MRWGKFILVFQAVLTLVIGLVFILQMLNMDNYVDKNSPPKTTEDTLKLKSLTEISSKFSTASYVLFVVAGIELILILRLIE